MLSILIPIYNFDVRRLAGELHRQAAAFPAAVEILCFDDGSEAHWKTLNRELAGLPMAVYKELPQNLGRSRIRNVLADAARGSHLLFMDCDSEVPDDAYLRRYLEALDEESLLYGGRVYRAEPPADPQLYLHWLYGSRREQMSPARRREQPYHHFMTNNFLIPAVVFQSIRFDERLLQYGHEDTLFGMELRKRKVPVKHLDNPLVHIGLEPAEAFLDKTRKGVCNLAFLYRSGTETETRIGAFYQQLQRLGLGHLVKIGLRPLRPLLRRNLLSRRPSLFFLDLYKLSIFLEELA
ncbi:MAG: glycosyltransferase [Phaeodactylibacter sp.]|nr:glycosyltransferase [Phaeodactylibacter sp.]MCB9288747.1 glycosyltransferase [Lewinellaceae bacterium]